MCAVSHHRSHYIRRLIGEPPAGGRRDRGTWAVSHHRSHYIRCLIGEPKIMGMMQTSAWIYPMRRVPCMFLSTEAVHDSPSNSGTCQKSNLVLGCVISKCQEKKCETQEKK